MNRWLRIFKHRWLDETDTARALDTAALQRLEARVAASERRHSGEIRLCVEAGLPLSYLWRGATARERALAMFGKLRVWDTEANSGVLIYLLLAEHAIEIVADRGLARQVPQAHWDTLVGGMREAFRGGRFEAGLEQAVDALVGGLREAFRAGRFEDGLAQAVDAVDAMLLRHFPLAEGQQNPNELPDRAHLG